MSKHLIVFKPRMAFVEFTDQGRALAEITGLSRREFDQLPGRVTALNLPNAPVQWKKRVSTTLTVYTEEAPMEKEKS